METEAGDQSTVLGQEDVVRGRRLVMRASHQPSELTQEPTGDLACQQESCHLPESSLPWSRELSPGDAAGVTGVLSLKPVRQGRQGTVVGHSALTGHVGCFSFAVTMNTQQTISKFSRTIKSPRTGEQNFGLLIKCLS